MIPFRFVKFMEAPQRSSLLKCHAVRRMSSNTKITQFPNNNKIKKIIN